MLIASEILGGVLVMDRVRESPTLSIAFLVLLSSSGVHAHDQSNNYFISSQERLWGFKKNKTLPLISLSLSLSLCFNPQSPVNLFPVQCLGKGKSSFLWASLFEQCLSCSWSGIFFSGTWEPCTPIYTYTQTLFWP